MCLAFLLACLSLRIHLSIRLSRMLKTGELGTGKMQSDQNNQKPGISSLLNYGLVQCVCLLTSVLPLDHQLTACACVIVHLSRSTSS